VRFSGSVASSSVNTPHHESSIEIVVPGFPRGPFRAAIVDFDGTLSLLRRNWQDVMIPMMVDELLETPTLESREQLLGTVEEFVMRLNGRQTIYQMMQLCEEVARRGGRPLDSLDYKRRYHDRLWSQVSARIEAVRSGQLTAESQTVPGAARLLEQLRDRGIQLYLASGTDLAYVRDELEVLDLHTYFGPRVYGAIDDFRQFSKARVIRQMIDEAGFAGSEILGLGDGFVEIEEVKRVGGLAIGVASDENARRGVDAWKRERLIRAGADIIVGDYRCHDVLLARIGIA